MGKKLFCLFLALFMLAVAFPVVGQADGEAATIYVYSYYSDTGSVWEKTGAVLNGTTLTEVAEEKAGYTFLGWFRGDAAYVTGPSFVIYDKLCDDLTYTYTATENIGLVKVYRKNGTERLDALDYAFRRPSTEYDRDLALIAAELSLATYTGSANHDSDCAVREYLLNYGFTNIYSDNYGGSLAYTVATREATLGGGEDDILVVVARGSSNGYELFQDIWTGWGEVINGYQAYDIVRDFYKDIFDGIRKVVKNDIEYKVLVTGHSLGGAAANLVGAKLTTGWYGRDNVYCYTFGSIDSIHTDGSVAYGYENIHNVTNYYDTFGPNGRKNFSANGNSGYGKFGHIDMFFLDLDKGTPFMDLNHGMEQAYLAAVIQRKVRHNDARDQKIVGYHCPVDVEIYRGEELVGRVVGDVVDESVTSIPISVADGEKFIYLDEPELYRFEVTATDSGTMRYDVWEATTGASCKVFTDVQLEPGKAFYSEVDNETDGQEIPLYVLGEDGSTIREVHEDGTETEIPPSETVTLCFPADALPQSETVEVDGVVYPVTDGTLTLPRDAKPRAITEFRYNKSSEDPHEVYPTGMRVWTVTDHHGLLTVTARPELEDILQYSGSSIRFTGVKGIRMITSIDKGKRSALIGSGLAGYRLAEYGTVVAWDSELEDAALVLDGQGARQAYAYKRGVSDPIFRDTGSLIQYTNVLVGLTDEKCVPDLAMRPYMILEDASGEPLVLYGGTIHRNIGYIAYQNRDAFQPGSDGYQFIWDIIHYVYQDAYDADYKG
ncbi:MAG: hypothetical protein IK095_02705 [Oscillospiraceae bacterium]|nr:hypothetical protein [Oscillospiraceae bacterium]